MSFGREGGGNKSPLGKRTREEDNASSVLSPDSRPSVQMRSPTPNPLPGFLAVPAATGSVPRPVSAPPSNEPTGLAPTWKCLNSFLRVLDKSSGVFGPIKVVMGDLIECIAFFENAAVVRQDYAVLKAQLEQVFSDLGHHFSGHVPQSLTAIMENLCGAIRKELSQISTKDRRGWMRHLQVKKDLDEVMECYRRIQKHLERLNFNANIGMWETVDELLTEARLRALNPSMSARYNSAEAAEIGRRNCTPETREQVLTDLSHWRYDRQQGNLFWLNGMAGTGKTTIANTFCATLDGSRELGASFFCTRLRPDCRDVKRILPSIAYQLARFSCPFRFALSRVLEADPDIHTLALPNQLKGLIAGPLDEVKHTLPNDLVVVIDALDECEDSSGVEQMLQMLADQGGDFPIKIFVSSRPEPQVRERIGHLTSKIVLHELDDKIVMGDIETFLHAELASISISESELTALVERAGVLFIYAATVVRYIGAETSRIGRKERLHQEKWGWQICLGLKFAQI